MKTFLSASVLPLYTTKEIFGFALKTLALTSAELFSALLFSILTMELAFLSSFEKIPVNIQKRSKARVINDVFTVLLMISNNKK